MSVRKVIEDIETSCIKNVPTIKVATPFFKQNNKTDKIPDYYLHETDK